MIEVDGEIREAVYEGGMAWGRIHHDRKNRFPNGTHIHTSTIQSSEEELETGATIVRTRNSVYRVYTPEQFDRATSGEK